MVSWLTDLLDECVNRLCRARDVRIAKAEVDDIDARFDHLGLPPIHLGESIRGQGTDPPKVHVHRSS
jgi:hypothetical protein